MTLRNAFEELGTEGMLRKIFRAVTFPRDSADRMRVVVDSQSGVSVYGGNNSTSTLNGQFVAPHSQMAWNLHDIRAQYQEQTHQSFQGVRNRWTIT